MGHLKNLLLPLNHQHAPLCERDAQPSSYPFFSLLQNRKRRPPASLRHVNFTNATSDELEKLAQACEPATFGRNDETVMDETYRRTAKMDPDLFSTPLRRRSRTILTSSTFTVRASPYPLLTWQSPSCHPGQGAFFKPNVDTPRSKKMFGSLVLVFPTPHEGGALLARHRGTEWTFDSAAELSAAPPSSIGYAAFLSDVEHEVAPVLSGHRITLTYNLYFDDDGFDDDGFDDDGRGSVSGPLTAPPLQTEMEHDICAAFEALLENPIFLPYGGILGFGLRHVYQFKGHFQHVYGLFKGSDAVLYRAVRSLGFKAVLYLYYEHRGETGLIDHVLDFDTDGEWDPIGLIRMQGGITGEDTPVDWVTPVTTFNCRSSTFVAFGNEASLELAYGHLCLIVHIGKVGQRTVKKVWEDAWEWLPD